MCCLCLRDVCSVQSCLAAFLTASSLVQRHVFSAWCLVSCPRLSWCGVFKSCLNVVCCVVPHVVCLGVVRGRLVLRLVMCGVLVWRHRAVPSRNDSSRVYAHVFVSGVLVWCLHLVSRVESTCSVFVSCLVPFHLAILSCSVFASPGMSLCSCHVRVSLGGCLCHARTFGNFFAGSR